MGRSHCSRHRVQHRQEAVKVDPPGETQGVWDLPWNEDDLMHFKRVLIPDFELHERLSNASALEWLSMAYARLEAKSRNAVRDRLLNSDDNLLKALLEYGENIFGIAKHLSVSLLPRDVDSVRID
jgi:hypothetical protein